MKLDDTTIRELIDFTDDLGVLSFYVGHTPERAADPQPTAPIEIRNQVKDLKTRLADGDAKLAKAVSKRLDALSGDIERLLDPKAYGRGRALFAGVSSGRTETVSLQVPFRERVVHHDSAYVRPLVAAFDEGRPAGVLVVWRDGARLLQWSVGEVEELETDTFELTDAQTADIKSGPSPSNPQHPHHGYVNRERFEDRIDENYLRFLRSFAERAISRAKEDGWDRIVLSGPPKIREAAEEVLRADGARVLTAEPSWEDTAPHQIAEQAWPLLRSVHLERERELVDEAVERALSGNAGAVGFRKVCDALNEGRVSHLLFRDDLEMSGYRSSEGTLHARIEGTAAAKANLTFEKEPLFIERLIEKTVDFGGKVTPVAHESGARLQEHEGVAALLRW